MTLKQEAIRLLFAISSLMLVVMFTGTNLSIPISVTAVESPLNTKKQVFIISKIVVKNPIQPIQDSPSQVRKVANIFIAKKHRKIANIPVRKNPLDTEIDKSDFLPTSVKLAVKSASTNPKVSRKEIKSVSATLNRLIRKTDLKSRLSTLDSKIN